MDFWRSFVIAFSMYSRVPAPRVLWNAKSSRFVLLFFPLVGLLEGMLQCLIWEAAAFFQLPVPMQAVFLTAFPFFYTGGIHLDGFLDTADALGSWKSREERLHILKDVHTGSFAVLSCVLLCLFQFSAWASLSRSVPRGLIVLPYVLSRIASAMSLLLLPNARGDGSAYRLSSAASRRITVGGIVLLFLAAAAYVGVRIGQSAYPVRSTAVPLSALAGALYAAMRARRAFGGMTGDLAGFLLTVSELTALLAAALAFHR